jgi:hypothetical protein
MFEVFQVPAVTEEQSLERGLLLECRDRIVEQLAGAARREERRRDAKLVRGVIRREGE